MFLKDTAFLIRVLKFFTCLEMPLNITQQRVSVWILNNRNFLFRPKLTNFIGLKSWNISHLYFKLHLLLFPMNLVLLLLFVIAVLSPRCIFYITSANTVQHDINVGYFLIRFAQTKVTLFIFVNK